jgi:tetratricopeptide (TPR) repeat protein
MCLHISKRSAWKKVPEGFCACDPGRRDAIAMPGPRGRRPAPSRDLDDPALVRPQQAALPRIRPVRRRRQQDAPARGPGCALRRGAHVERDEEAALAAYRRAAELQPENPESWYQLGLYEFSRGDRCSAYVHLNRSYTLDPAAKHWTPDSELEQALEWVNAPGNC